MTNIEGGNNFIKFGKQQVELKKSDGVKKDAIVKNNDSVNNAIFQKFDENGDGILDTSELENMYSALKNASKNGT